MLVLSRKCGEAVEIGGGIRITVVQVGTNQVRLGIDAPRETPIVRPEATRKAAPPEQTRCRAAKDDAIAQADRRGTTFCPPISSC